MDWSGIADIINIEIKDNSRYYRLFTIIRRSCKASRLSTDTAIVPR
jgi:hypothetical protein